jgi:hypothetical protein
VIWPDPAVAQVRPYDPSIDQGWAATFPAIGQIGEHGIPLRDEIELVRDL